LGSIRPGPPTELVIALKNQFFVRNFVETGTFMGETARWASTYFERVITIEASPHLYDAAKTRLGLLPNVERFLGDTRAVLPTVVASLEGPVIFWLDSHWSAGETAGKDDECPLIEEIEIINKSSNTSFLLIDDARLFASPPPPPHDWRHWPTMSDVLRDIEQDQDRYYTVTFDDVIISVPKTATEALVAYCRSQPTAVDPLPFMPLRHTYRRLRAALCRSREKRGESKD